MQSSQDGDGNEDTRPLDWSMQRRILWIGVGANLRSASNMDPGMRLTSLCHCSHFKRNAGVTVRRRKGSYGRADLHRPHHGACYIAEALKRPRHRSPTSRRLLRRSRLIIGSSRECQERTSSTQSPLLSVPSSLAFRMHGERCNIFMSCPFVTGRAEIPFG
jgi:hypothetical protein